MRRTAHYKWLKDDAYRDAFEQAKLLAVDSLTDEAVRRAREGTMRPVFYQGEICGEVFEYSDGLMMFLLTAWDRKRYGQQVKQDVSLELGPKIVERLLAARQRCSTEAGA